MHFRSSSMAFVLSLVVARLAIRCPSITPFAPRCKVEPA
jgi:hypothetical protein